MDELSQEAQIKLAPQEETLMFLTTMQKIRPQYIAARNEYNEVDAEKRKWVLFHDLKGLLTSHLGVLEFVGIDDQELKRLLKTEDMNNLDRIVACVDKLPEEFPISFTPELQVDLIKYPEIRQSTVNRVEKVRKSIKLVKQMVHIIAHSMKFLHTQDMKSLDALTASRISLETLSSYFGFKYEFGARDYLAQLNGQDFITVFNLCKNAARFHDKYLKSHYPDTQVVIAVRDGVVSITNKSVVGLPQDPLKIGVKGKSPESNTGFGLAIAQQFQLLEGKEVKYREKQNGPEDFDITFTVKLGKK